MLNEGCVRRIWVIVGSLRKTSVKRYLSNVPKFPTEFEPGVIICFVFWERDFGLSKPKTLSAENKGIGSDQSRPGHHRLCIWRPVLHTRLDSRRQYGRQTIPQPVS
jgi:hypothetical protein